MNAEDMKELKELIEFLKDNNIGEFDLERGDLKVRIKFAQEGGADMAALARLVASQPAAVPPPAINLPVHAASGISSAQPGAPETAAPVAESEQESLHIVKSPIVG